MNYKKIINANAFDIKFSNLMLHNLDNGINISQ